MQKKILFITLSNIGDAVLTLPVLDRVQFEFPDSNITVLGSKKVGEVFYGNPKITKFISYDKKATLQEKLSLTINLFKENFDVIIDLKDTFLGFLLKVRRGIFPFRFMPRSIKHMKERHLLRAGFNPKDNSPKTFFSISRQDKEQIDSILSKAGIDNKDKVIVLSCGARSKTKVWQEEKFVELISNLIKEYNFKIILVGDSKDKEVSNRINGALGLACLDLSGKTSLQELACILKRSELLISNDSAVMHIASYLNIPVVAIFGITDDAKYGPWPEKSFIVKKEIFCRPCSKAGCLKKARECFDYIKAEDVLLGVRRLLRDKEQKKKNLRLPYKRILIIRTDRIGDLVLSTPFIKAVRQNYPHAFISMIVSSYTKDIVDGNPYLDKVITYDKDTKHKGWLSTLAFSWGLRKYKFDVVFILHPTNRAHLISWLAGIPNRLGFNRKFGFLLTKKAIHRKQLGEKHELEYTNDLLKLIGIDSLERSLFMPIKEESEKWVEEFLSINGIEKSDKLLIIHPAASCPSKVWPVERFSQVADTLSLEYGFKVLVVSGVKDVELVDRVVDNMQVKAVSLAGGVSLSQLASLLKRATLLISNDSGPVHIASALEVPVIAIFGRNQPGLSPKRWGPIGRKDKVLHKDIGCIECLAHNCKNTFACLKAITIEDALSCARDILK